MNDNTEHSGSHRGLSGFIKSHPRRAKFLLGAEIVALVAVVITFGSALGSSETKTSPSDEDSKAAVSIVEGPDDRIVPAVSVKTEEDPSLPDSSETAAEDPSLPDSSDASEDDSSSPELSEPSAESSSASEGDHINALKDLKQTLEDKFASFDGTWSCYLKNLNTGDWFEINNHTVYPASMIKLFALAACYQKIEDGYIDESKVYATLFSMAAISNNQAFNMIVWEIGKTYITEWCQEHGYTGTAQYHGLQPSTNYEGLTTADLPNKTCCVDVGHILESIYRGECVSEYASQQMLNILFEQKYRGKLPSALPYGARAANKTGDTYNVSHDAAIIYSDGADYVLVVMEEIPDVAFEQHFRFFDISKTVYAYFNPGAYDEYEQDQ